MSSPRVTVILSSFNHGRFIAEAIQSTLDQTYKDFEFFIVDDCSDDDSWRIIQSFDDPRILAIRNPVRSRAAFGFNEIIRHRACGEFIAIHHSDDVWLPTKLERQIAFLDQHPEVGAVFTRVHLIDEQGTSIDPDHYYQPVFGQKNRSRFEWLRHFFLDGNCLCHPSVLARKEVMLDAGLYDRRLGQITDFDLWVRICLHHQIYILNEPLLKFRLRSGNANQSGESGETFVRLRNEWQIVLRRFLVIDSEDEFFSIFPEMRSLSCPNGNDLRYLIAVRAIRTDAAFRKQFGIGLLYHLMADDDTVTMLKEKYGFGYVELIDLMGRADPFQGVELSKLVDRIRRLQMALMLMKSSTTWLRRLVAPLMFVWRAVRRVRREGFW